MGVFSHSRNRVFSQAQHPFTHNIEDIAYSHPSVTGVVTTLAQAMNYIFAVLYPTQKEAVADLASLPTTGNTLGDMRVVVDSGDGRSSSFRWDQREGEFTPSWKKIYDVDFSTDSILASWQNVTQDQYVQKSGRDDIDASGNPIVGILGGQSVYGGKSANTHLTMFANSGDGTGPNTGYIQVGDNVRPLADNMVSLGTSSNRFKDFKSVIGQIGLLNFFGNNISSSSNDINFGICDLSTTGVITSDKFLAPNGASVLGSGTKIGDLSLNDGSIISDSDAIDFGVNDLITAGDAFLAGINIVGNQISSDTNVIDFASNDLVDVNSIDSTIGIFEHVQVGLNGAIVEIRPDGNIYKTTHLDVTSPQINLTGDVNADGDFDAAGYARVVGEVKTLNKFLATDPFGVASIAITAGNSGNKISSTGFGLQLESTDDIRIASPTIKPDGINTDLGTSANKFRNIYLSGSITNSNGHNLSQTAISALRNVMVEANEGDALFWSSADQCFYPDHPDSEIIHSEITGLGNDDHTQYLNINGRLGGQIARGGTGASNNLTLASTSHWSKGLILFDDVLAPVTDGTDFGTFARQIGDSYFKGQAKGFRVENTTTVTLPSPSAAKIGRLVYDQTAKALLVDDGGQWRRCGAEKAIVVDNDGWNGSVSTKTYNVSSQILDASKSMWEFLKTSTGERLYPVITRSTSTVTVTFKTTIPAQSYTLIGVS